MGPAHSSYERKLSKQMGNTILLYSSKQVWYSGVPTEWKGGAGVKSNMHFECDFQFAIKFQVCIFPYAPLCFVNLHVLYFLRKHITSERFSYI